MRSLYETGEDDIETIAIKVDESDILLVNVINDYIRANKLKEIHSKYWLDFIKTERVKMEKTPIDSNQIQQDIKNYLEETQEVR